MLAVISCLREWQVDLQSVAKPFTIITDHINLSYFATKQLLNERQIRYSELLQQFNFNLRWRPGSTNKRPEVLSRREQDKPHGLSDERTAGRIKELIPPIQALPTAVAPPADIFVAENDSASETRLFDDDNDDTEALWRKGVELDKDWRRARDAVQAGEHGLPPDIAS